MRRVLSPDERRAELLAAYRSVFAEQGYHASGIGDITRSVGCSRGTFYNYFDSKRDVFGSVLADIMGEVVAVIRPIDVSQSIGPQVRENVTRLVRAIMTQDILRILFAEASGIDSECDEALREFYAGATERIERALREGQQLGVVRPGDTRVLARCLLGLLKEPVFQAHLFSEPLDPEDLVQQVLAVISEGILR